MKSATAILALCALAVVASALVLAPPGDGASAADAPPPASRITHKFLAVGHARHVALIGPDGKVLWSFPHPASDVLMLPGGNVLTTLYPSKTYPHGAVVELNPKGKVVWQWNGTQQELSTAWPLQDGNTLITELGKKPRLLEVTRAGKIAVDLPLKCQTKNVHMETRMARKLSNGDYLVPHPIEMEVREYTPAGKIVWKVKTPNWPFTAIRLDNGNTVIGCTLGNVVQEVDRDGKLVWQLSNKDLGSEMIKDACGVQRLPNGNTVVTSYRIGKGIKLIEVTPEKQIVWTYNDGTAAGIHEFEILETDGVPLTGRVLK